MSLVLKNAGIVDSLSKYNGQKKDILIEKGIITQVGNNLSAKSEFDCSGLLVSVGWLDMRVQSLDPGFEHRETFESLLQSAAKGGITGVGTLPNSKPTVDSKDVLEYIKAKTNSNIVDVYPYASVTKSNKGKELVEMLDLSNAGAVAFSDGENNIWHTGILLKSLQYLQKVDQVIISKVFDKYLSKEGLVNEGINSTLTGLKGIPSLAETLAFQKVLEVLTYTGGKFHFSCISTKESVILIKEAKKKGLSVTCDVAAHQLAFDDSVINDFDSNYKVNPPFRTKEDIQALQKGLKDGVIDAIVSDHTPHDVEAKQLEFDLADFGIIGVQTLFSVANTYSKLSVDQLIDKMTKGPRNILNIDYPKIEEGSIANITVFDDKYEWVFEEKMNVSKSRNTPFIGQKLKGKAIAIYNKGVLKKIG